MVLVESDERKVCNAGVKVILLLILLSLLHRILKSSGSEGEVNTRCSDQVITVGRMGSSQYM